VFHVVLHKAPSFRAGLITRFPSFPAPASNNHSTAMVTAYGPSSSPTHCKPTSWFADQLNVRCYGPSGTEVAFRHLAHLVNLTD
jgi:hypothetical protein